MAKPSGLFKASTGDVLPLRSVSIKADVKGYVLGLRATMKYLNEDKDPVEVLFKLPLESSQAVVGLTACIDGKKIRADIQEKEQAKTNYDDAIASGQTAAYGETKTDDVFSIALGNLPGGEEAEIELQMVDELPVDAEGKVRFSLPATFKPRYTPPGSLDPLAPIAGGDATVEHGKISGFQEFLLHVHKGDAIADVSSPTHKIKVAPGTGDVLDVTIDNCDLTTDLVIQITHKAPHQPMVLVEQGNKCNQGVKPAFLNRPAVMFNFFPEIPHVDVSCELIFLVDRSGSMSGGFIKSASETLVLFLKSMPEGSYFNIYGFGSSFVSLFPSSVLYNQETLAKATAHAQGLNADLGGTEVLPPLREIFRQPEIKGITRQIFLLTDGAVSNTSSCVDEVRKNSHKARCFTFGIGSGASTALVNGIAEAGNGTAEFVKFGERLQPKVIRSLKHALQPAVTDVKVTFSTPSNAKVLTSPKSLPPLFSGEKTVVYGIIEVDGSQDNTLTGKAKLSGTLLGAEISHNLSFEIVPVSQDSDPDSVLPVHRLAAKRLLEDMKTDNKPDDDIIELSITAHVISNKTAFIAVNEDTSKVVTGALKTIDIEPSLKELDTLAQVQATMAANISLACTRGDSLDSLQDQSDMLSAQSNMFYKSAKQTRSSGGWLSGIGSTIAGFFSGSRNSDNAKAASLSNAKVTNISEAMDDCMDNSMMSCEIDDIMSSERDRISVNSDELEKELDELEENEEQNALFNTPAVVPASLTAPPMPKPAVNVGSSDTIVLLQQANGSWLLDESFSVAVGIQLKTAQSHCPKGCDSVVWATILAVVILRVKYLAQQDEWDLVVGKANSWLKGHTSSTEQLQEWISSAEKMVATI